MAEAVNDSEQFVYDICSNSFLSLWSYINPQGKDPGKELCDVLIVCNPHVIIISVKDIKLKNTNDPMVDWKRWQRKAIEGSIKQIKGAIRWLDQLDYVVQKDGSRGLNLPLPSERIYHRIAVAFGGEREVPISSSIEEGDFFHILDEKSVFLILRHLDTISDFVDYLINKEVLLSNTSIIINGGEENLLAIYLHNGRQFPTGVDMVLLENDLWEEINNKPEFQAKLRRDTISYIWDDLIEVFCQGGFDREDWLSSNMSDFEIAIRVLVKENRFSRRLLGSAFKDFLELKKMGRVSSRCMQSMSGVGYVFFAYASNSTFEERKRELLVRCFASLCQFHECSTVIGVGVNIPGQKPKYGYSSDLVLLQAQNNQWSEEDLRQAKYCRDELGFFKNPNKTQLHEDEYPVIENIDDT
ncbi:hypothetical protein AMR42_00275 [Limnothrix sp. PR1529]|uniref:NERD domain-containing protein n=1 Tax=Limnothrix sp. PR1529 TaxID=1704291 RepID=UPI00081DACCC|nr:NERD domain-containing protein [Limnothrix sp. PR1529]OCQ99311.1 hypothetical protein BCR12_02465 [Limnothrix sp. P13C2]PIB15731.1 hypothetical protein AMR42_00275 [Limnothrix sp. PR1529]